MRVGQFPNIVAFVEGSMERMFVNQNFHYVRVISISNGDSWTIEAMCKQIASFYRLIRVPPDLIVVWFDRENSKFTSTDIAKEVERTLVREGWDSDKLSIFIPDRMSENLFLADEKLIRESFNIEDYVYPGDGENGKGVIKGIFRSNGKKYLETFHGVSFLKKVRLGNSALVSASANEFYKSLKVNCWWK